MRMTNSHVLLTGASGGIGQTLAVQLASQGCSIHAVGRNESALSAVMAQLPDNGGRHQAIIADITTQEGRDRVAEQVADKDINLLINLAGSNAFVLFEAQQASSVTQLIDTNLSATLLLTQQLLPLLKRQPQATIINVGSTLGAIGYPGYAVYCATKFALRGFSEALGRELADTSIRVRYFAPRATATSLNSSAATAMNDALGNSIDSVEHVVAELLRFINKQSVSCHLGWPEKLFVKVNGILPSLVSRSIRQQLPIIKKFIS